MKLLTVFVVALSAACANSPPSDPTQDQDQTVTDAGIEERSPRVLVYCPPNQRPLFFVGSPDECAVIRFDCPPTTHYVADEACGCGCDY